MDYAGLVELLRPLRRPRLAVGMKVTIFDPEFRSRVGPDRRDLGGVHRRRGGGIL